MTICRWIICRRTISRWTLQTSISPGCCFAPSRIRNYSGTGLGPGLRRSSWRAGPASAGPAAQLGLALGDDWGRSLALALAKTGTAGNADRHERGDECDQKLFHRDPLY